MNQSIKEALSQVEIKTRAVGGAANPVHKRDLLASAMAATEKLHEELRRERG